MKKFEERILARDRGIRGFSTCHTLLGLLLAVAATACGDDPSGEAQGEPDAAVDDADAAAPSGDDPSGDDPSGDDPSGDDPSGDDPSGDDPSGDDPSGDDPSGDDPSGDDPSADDDPVTDETPNADDVVELEGGADDPETDDPEADDPGTDDPSVIEDSFVSPLPDGVSLGGELISEDGSSGAADDAAGDDSSPSGGSGSGTSTSGGTATPDAPGTPADEEGVSAETAISEADILLRDGDTVYALSAYAGLSVIDVSDPTDLVLLGNHRFEATPFEMYQNGDEVIVLFYGQGQWVYDAENGLYDYSEDSPVQVFDVSDPADIRLVDEVVVQGSLIDSRRVGDRLVIATNDDSWCYYCSTDAGARVGSYAIGDGGISEIEVLLIPREGEWAYSPTINVNDQRLYLATTAYGPIAGTGVSEPEPGVDGDVMVPAGMVSDGGAADDGAADDIASDDGASDDPTDDAVTDDVVMDDESDGGVAEVSYGSISTLQVVDISDVNGDLVLGDSVSVSGAVYNRWQVDESDGVLRVVAQPEVWGDPPVLDTFDVVSSQEIVPMASLTIQLPRPEDLQSVRFDGDRAYVVTFERVDPLFTLDLSDPANPVQVGELEMPGWLYHMMPRGDRLYAIGYDFDNVDSLHASVFDVSDLANPTMLSRVSFGSSWGSFAEDPDRIEKSVQLLAEEGLMLVPFAGYEDEDGCYSWSSYRSGIQLIDVGTDSLALRGVAQAKGFARRGFLHRDHLFGYSDEALQTFDVSDRDAPVLVDELALTHSVDQLVVSGDSLVRLGSDGWGRSVIDVTPLDAPNAPLGAFVEVTPLDVGGCGYTYYDMMIERDGIVYLPQYGVDYERGGTELRITAIDVRDAASPSVTGAVDVAGVDGTNWSGSLLLTDSALVVAQLAQEYDYGYPTPDDSVAGEDFDPGMGATSTPPESADDIASDDDDAADDDSVADATMMVEVQGDVIGIEPVLDSWTRSLRLVVFDLGDPEQPVHAADIDVDEALLDAGFAGDLFDARLLGQSQYSYSALATLVAGDDVIASQHHEPLEDGSGTRYFLDRIDLSDPSEPVWLPALNIPGQLLAIQSGDSGIVTLDRVQVPLDQAECEVYEDTTVCYTRVQQLSALELEESRAVRVNKVALGTTQDWSTFAVDESAIFRQHYRSSDDNYAISAFDRGLGELGNVTPSELGAGYYAELTRLGDRVGFVGDQVLGLFDVSSGMLEGGPSGANDTWCGYWVLADDTAYCPAGQRGVVTVELE